MITIEATNNIQQGLNPAPRLISLGNKAALTGSRVSTTRSLLKDLPSAEQASNDFYGIIEAEKRQESTVRIQDLRMADTGHITRGAGMLTISPEALGQMLARTSFPEATAAATYLTAIPANRRAKEFNAIINGYADDEQEIVLRHRLNILDNGSTAGRGIYAAVSDRYIVQDAHTVLANFVQQLLDSNTYEANDLRMSLLSDSIRTEALIHYKTGTVAGEEHSAYFRFRTGDSGKHAHSGEFGVFRLVCSNGLTVANPWLSSTVRHSGNNSRTLVERMLKVGPAVLSLFSTQWEQATNTTLEQFVDGLPQEGSTDYIINGVYRGLLNDTNLSLPGYRGDKAVDEFTKAWEKEPVTTKAGIINGITRAAHETPLLSMWSAEDVQAAAGRILASTRKVQFAHEE